MEHFNAGSLFSPSWNSVVCKICLKKHSLSLFVFLLPWIWHHFCQPLLSHEQKEHFLFSHSGQGMSQSFQETQCSLYAARENSKRGLPMVWEMAGSHRAHKAHSTAWPDSVPTKLVSYFLISKKRKGGRVGSKERSPISLSLNPCWGNDWSIALPNKAASTVGERERECLWWIQEQLLLTPFPTCCTCQVFVLWLENNRSFQNENMFDPKRIQNSVMVKLKTAIRHIFSCKLNCTSWSPKFFS